ncbi:MAG TPA: diaminopimelate decarboxylase [Clostridiaceae bacterium]|nr:diaminopimelate decarboxylase [Clostridiaceae bacterium]
MKLHGTMKIENNQLLIGDVSVEQLRAKYGTPLYIIDQTHFAEQANVFLTNFRSEKFQTHISYASKAFSNLYILGLAKELGLFLDVVSGGELYTALSAGYNPEKISFHGNNKLPEELEMVLANDIGRIIVDHYTEYSLLSALAAEKQKKVKVLLRINPGIEADTHKYIQTTGKDSKFGMSIADPVTYVLLKDMNSDPWLELEGIHCHIGSQILDKEFFFREAAAMFSFARNLLDDYSIIVREINLGGGFGVYYTKEDQPFDYAEFLAEYIVEIERIITELDLTIDTVSIEPGRSLINASGSTLYTVGAVKQPYQGKPFVFVDGGMTDNPRPALYQAKYEACLANRMQDEVTDNYRVAGKCCETGDILIQDIALPQAEPGDLLLIPGTGAYNYAMSSNYNRIPRPAVVFVENGQSHLAVKRETYEDLIRNDQKYFADNSMQKL